MRGKAGLPICPVDYKRIAIMTTDKVHEVNCITCLRILATKGAA